MAALDYDEFTTLALELIRDTGREITIEKLLAAPQDEDKPWRGVGTDGQTVEASVDTFGTFVPPSGTDLGQIVTDKELLKRVEQVVLVPGNEEPIELYTSILDGGSRWKIDWAQVLKPGDTIVLYAFGIKR